MNLDSVNALIRLMDDPDDQIFSLVYDKLKSYGPAAIPHLESSWEEDDFGLIFQQRIENLIHEIQFENTKQLLSEWISSDEKDLLKGAIIVAKFQYPGLSEEKIYAQIEQLRKDIWLEISQGQTSFEKIRIFNKVFFERYGFHGNSKNFLSPLNSFINTVLELKTGNPLSLSLLYSVIAQQLEMPVYGVNLPNHFILAYMDQHHVHIYNNTKNQYGVLFYINAFSKGSFLYEGDITDFLKQLGVQAQRSHFEPCANSHIILRMIVNLISSYQSSGNVNKVRELVEMRNLFH